MRKLYRYISKLARRRKRAKQESSYTINAEEEQQTAHLLRNVEIFSFWQHVIPWIVNNWPLSNHVIYPENRPSRVYQFCSMHYPYSKHHKLTERISQNFPIMHLPGSLEEVIFRGPTSQRAYCECDEIIQTHSKYAEMRGLISDTRLSKGMVYTISAKILIYEFRCLKKLQSQIFCAILFVFLVVVASLAN